MNLKQIEEYRRDKNFQRNESIWVFHTVDKLSSEEIGKHFNISADSVGLIIDLHQRYWDATKR